MVDMVCQNGRTNRDVVWSVWRHPRYDWFTDMKHGHVVINLHNRELCKKQLNRSRCSADSCDVIQIQLTQKHIVNTACTHTCCIGRLNGRHDVQNCRIDRDVVWRYPRHDSFTDMNLGHVVIKGHNRELCKTAEPIEMLGWLVWCHSRHDVDTASTHTCCTGLLNGADMRKNGGTDVRPIEWSTWCAKMAEPIEMSFGRFVTFSGSWGVPLSYGKPDFHGGRTFSSSRFWGFMVMVTGRSTG